jgi:hypothetical protein
MHTFESAATQGRPHINIVACLKYDGFETAYTNSTTIRFQYKTVGPFGTHDITSEQILEFFIAFAVNAIMTGILFGFLYPDYFPPTFFTGLLPQCNTTLLGI